MRSQYIGAGFSDIKLQLIKKCRLDKTPNELTLWFSIENDILWAHDFHHHAKCVTVAIIESNNPKYLLDNQVYGQNLLEFAVTQSKKNGHLLDKELNELFRLNGTLGSRRDR